MKPTLYKLKHITRDIRQYIFCKNKDINLDNYKYFIYIDSKVPNIIEQIYPYFYNGFFEKNEVVVVYRFYFENIISMRRSFEQYDFKSYCFINLRDIPSLENAVWFYTHNSMTNLAVINKNVYSKHIWMGHGESDKVSSYKKIIRIYDYCLVAGQRTIDRYYKYKLFREEDSYRFIRVGKVVTCFAFPSIDKSGEKAILYAPTWEGPTKEENYSAHHLHKETIQFFSYLFKKTNTKKLVVKLHPNSGIRDSKVIDNILTILNQFVLQKVQIIFICEKDSWIYNNIYKKIKDKNSIKLLNSLIELQKINFAAGVTNISAMASVLYGSGVDTYILYDKNMKIEQKIDIDFVKKVDLRNFRGKINIVNQNNLKQKNGLFEYEKNWEKLTQEEIFKEVIEWIK